MIPENAQLIVRESMGSPHEFLHFQVGFLESRAVQIPIVAANERSHQVIGYRDGKDKVVVFHLLGCGHTLQRAYQVAGMVPPSVPTKSSLANL